MPTTRSATSPKPRRSSARATSAAVMLSASTRSAASTSSARSRSGTSWLEWPSVAAATSSSVTAREAELVEDGLDRAGGALAHRQDGLLSGRLDARVHLPVALQRHPLVEVVGVVVAAAEGVVVPRHDAVARGDEIRAGQELAHQLGRAARGGVRRDRVVAGGDLEVEPGGDQVLGQDRARAAGQAHRQRDARDGAVLHALRPAGAHEAEAARLEREHRAALAVAHQRFRARARCETHLDTAAGVGRGEERLRPGRVVAVREGLVGAVHRERLGVGDESLDREPQIEALLDRALRHHAGAPRLRADEQGHGIERRVARDARPSSRTRRSRAVRPRPRRPRAAPGSP